MSDILIDAFKNDSEIRVFGEDIFLNNTTTVHTNDLPESKSNNVSFMKVEELSIDCRNLLAVSESCICYSVTQKKNLLRLIDTITGDKEILRGHEGGVTDLKFSSADSTILCTTDNSETIGKPHTIVWKKNDTGINFQATAQLQLRGVVLVSHPTQSNIWAISDGHSVGVFSSARVNLNSPGQYAELPMSVQFDSGETVTDVSFSSDGRQLVVALAGSSGASHFQVLRISGQEALIRGNESLVRVFDSLRDCPSADLIVSVRCVHSLIVTASRSVSAAVDDKTVRYVLQVWSGAQDGLSPSVLQTLNVDLPLFKSRSPSSSLRNPHLECALQMEPRNDQYLILTSRRSSLVVCLAVSPAQRGAALPLYHVTYLSLKAPVVSMDVTSILGREHHSAEEGEHLEMSCYQEEASDQASIQQYHVLFSALFDLQKHLAVLADRKPEVVAPVASIAQSESKGKTILGMLNGANSNNLASSSNLFSSFLSVAPAVVAAPRPTTEEQSASQVAPLSLSPVGPVSGLTAGISPLSYFSSPSPQPEAVKTAPSLPLTPVGSSNSSAGLPSFLNLGAVPKNTNILSMIKNNSSSNALPIAITPPKPVAVTPTKAVVATPVATPTSVTLESVSVPVTVSITVPPVEAKVETPSSAKKSSDSAATREKLQSVQDKVQREKEQLKAATDVAATNISSFTTSTITSSNKKVEKAPKTPTDDRSETSSVTSLLSHVAATVPSASTTPIHGTTNSSSSSGNLLSSSSIDLNGTPASVSSSLSDIKQAVRLIAKGAVSKELLASVKDELLRETRAAHVKAAEQSQAALKKVVEAEAKKAVETALAAGKWKQELSASIAEALQAELAPLIAQKVRDAVKDTVRDTVKSALASSFRSAFDSSLVPAFQTGTERMFSQVQTSFEAGMGGLVEEGRKAQQAMHRSTESLESEIRGLKHTIHTLEASVLELSDRVGVIASMRFAAPEEEQAEDPFALLEKGLVSDALLRALEDKDVSTTIALLDRLTPSQVNASCSGLVRLCITQQLAADMSVNAPEEGIAKRVEWVKNLVLSLVSAPAAPADSDPTYERSFKSTIQMVLESLQAAKHLVFDNLDGGAVPQSVGTDLQLLEFVIQSKL